MFTSENKTSSRYRELVLFCKEVIKLLYKATHELSIHDSGEIAWVHKLWTIIFHCPNSIPHTLNTARKKPPNITRWFKRSTASAIAEIMKRIIAFCVIQGIAKLAGQCSPVRTALPSEFNEHLDMCHLLIFTQQFCKRTREHRIDNRTLCVHTMTPPLESHHEKRSNWFYRSAASWIKRLLLFDARFNVLWKTSREDWTNGRYGIHSYSTLLLPL